MLNRSLFWTGHDLKKEDELSPLLLGVYVKSFHSDHRLGLTAKIPHLLILMSDFLKAAQNYQFEFHLREYLMTFRERRLALVVSGLL